MADDEVFALVPLATEVVKGRVTVRDKAVEFVDDDDHSCRWCPHDWTGKGEG